jgi:hypothetical protein
MHGGREIMRNNRSTFLLVVVAVLVILSWMAADAVLRVDAANGDSTIRFKRTFSIAAGKNREAAQMAKEIAKYVSDNYSETTVVAYMETLGDLGEVSWFADYKDLATLESVFQRLAADQGYQAIVNRARAGGLLLEGTGRDTLYRQIP